MRTYRLAPTVAAVALFLVAGNLLVLWSMPEEVVNTPEDDAWIVYYAVVFEPEPPANLTTSDLESLARRLDPSAAEAATRFTVVAYEGTEYGFRLRASHVDGEDFLITSNGVGRDR